MFFFSKRISVGVVLILLLSVCSVPVECDDGPHFVRSRSLESASKEVDISRQQDVEDLKFWDRFLQEGVTSFPPLPSTSPTQSPTKSPSASPSALPSESPSSSPSASPSSTGGSTTVVADFTSATREDPLTFTSFGSDFVIVVIDPEEVTVHTVQGNGNVGSTCPPTGGVEIPSSATIITIPLGGVDTTVVICRDGFIIGVCYHVFASNDGVDFDYQVYVDFSAASNSNPLSFNFQTGSGSGTGLIGNGGYFLGGGADGSGFIGRGGFFFAYAGVISIGDPCPPAGATTLPIYPEFPFTLFALEFQESGVVYACVGTVVGLCEFEYNEDAPSSPIVPPTVSPIASTNPPSDAPSISPSQSPVDSPLTNVTPALITGQLFNTGVDATGAALGFRMDDPHYSVVENDNAPAVAIFPHSSYFPNNANSTWIWQMANGRPAFVTRTFETSFDLTGYDSTSAKISGSWGADNFGLDILINSVSTGITLNPPNFSLFPFTIDLGFVAGQNVLRFVVQDVGAIAGFRVDNIELTAVPVPSTSPPTPDPTVSPTVSPTFDEDLDFFLDQLIPEYSQAPAQTMPGSPQGKALSWLKSDPAVEDYSDFKTLQRFALATLFYATGGVNWISNANWLDYNQNECEWFSSPENGDENVPCGGAGEQITSLSLQDNGMAGTLPNELAILTDLLDMHFENDDLSGTIPTRYGLLTNLETLQLPDLSLSGNIPVELGEISSLELFLLSANDLVGFIPTELGKLTLLTAMLASSNRLSGNLPTELSECTLLELLSFRSNNLTGKLPTELGRLTGLTGVSLYENMFTGAIPSELGLLENLQLLFLDENNLTGPIPSEFGKMSGLLELWVNGNQLTGSVPEEVCNLVLNNNLEIIIDCEVVECDCGCLCATP